MNGQARGRSSEVCFSFNWWWAKLVGNRFCESGDPGLDVMSCPSTAIWVCPSLKGPGHHEPAGLSVGQDISPGPEVVNTTAGQALCSYGWPLGAAHGRSAFNTVPSLPYGPLRGPTEKSYKSLRACDIHVGRCADSQKITVARPLSRDQAVSSFIAAVLDA